MLSKVPKEFFGIFRSTYEHDFGGLVKKSLFNIIVAEKGKKKK